MKLTDGRFLLRKFRPEDVEPFHEAVRESIPELSRWMPWCTETYCLKESRDWVASREAAWVQDEEYSFVIADLDDSRILGGCGLNGINPQNNFVNLGYWVRTGAAGRGIATAATRLLARWAIREMGMQRVEILAAAENARSIRVAEKAGAVREGVLRNRIVVHGRRHDAVMFSIIPSDELVGSRSE